jgi:hypothetical protein
MAARLAALLPRLAALTIIWLLATSTITFAAAGRKAAPTTPIARPAEPGPAILVVPDVRRQAYVFAKGILDDGGFAWRVAGDVKGYAVNTVTSQSPAPGTRVVDTGAPVVRVRLARNASYEQRGLPESQSPHAGTKVVLASTVEQPSTEAPPAAAEPPAEEPPAEEPPAEEPPAEEQPAEPAQKKDSKPADQSREPDFEVPGAPPEPTDEMRLPDRARLLERRLAAHAEPTRALAKYWLYQHAWIVTGAQFGWQDGADALRILVRVDHDLQARWGFGAKSEAVARAALAEVEAKAGA